MLFSVSVQCIMHLGILEVNGVFSVYQSTCVFNIAKMN